MKFFRLENEQPGGEEHQVPNYLKLVRKLLRENKHHRERNHEVAEFKEFLYSSIFKFLHKFLTCGTTVAPVQIQKAKLQRKLRGSR